MAPGRRQQRFARRAMWMTVAIGILALGYFLYQGQVVTGVIISLVLAASGYFEYQRRIRDLEGVGESKEEGSFEKQERLR